MHGPPAPSPWIVRFADLAPRGLRVLDVACGAGRHARFFLDRGYEVTATDIDVSGLDDLRGRDGLALVAHDLEDGPGWPFADERFGAVVVTNYLHRPLLPALVASVADGGVLLYETFGAGNEAFGKPSRPDFLLRPGELIEAVRGSLQIVAYEHGRDDEPRPAIRQRLCAVKGSEPARLSRAG